MLFQQLILENVWQSNQNWAKTEYFWHQREERTKKFRFLGKGGDARGKESQHCIYAMSCNEGLIFEYLLILMTNYSCFQKMQCQKTTISAVWFGVLVRNPIFSFEAICAQKNQRENPNLNYLEKFLFRFWRYVSYSFG